MKTILIISLLAFTFCFGEPDLVGGWTKRSLRENSFAIDQAFKMAGLKYSLSNDSEQDDLIRLTVYSQIVSGTNYKVTFVDQKASSPSIQEYIIYMPLNMEIQEIQIIDHNEYKTSNGLIPKDEPAFKVLEKKLHKYLKDGTEKLGYISYVYPVQNDETKFYFVNANTENGEHLYLVCQEISTGDYFDIHKVK